jgi:tRNA-binding protein
MTEATIEDFLKLDIRVGQIISCELNEKARVPAYKLKIDFGDEIGIKQSSAQLCDNYSKTDLINQHILAVVNFPSRRVAGFKSEVLVLGTLSDRLGTVIIQPERPVELGGKLG